MSERTDKEDSFKRAKTQPSSSLSRDVSREALDAFNRPGISRTDVEELSSGCKLGSSSSCCCGGGSGHQRVEPGACGAHSINTQRGDLSLAGPQRKRSVSDRVSESPSSGNNLSGSFRKRSVSERVSERASVASRWVAARKVKAEVRLSLPGRRNSTVTPEGLKFCRSSTAKAEELKARGRAGSGEAAVMSAATKASIGAREELAQFADAPLPTCRGCFGPTLYLFVRLLRVPLLWTGGVALLGPFYGALVRLGGVERIYVLLTIARFDPKNTGKIDEHERQAKGHEMVNDAASTCSSMSVVSSLMIGLSHLQAIGRPVAWEASGAFLDAHGDAAADRLLWAVHAANALTEALAVTLLLLCVPFRVLLTSVLPSLDSKLMVLCESNLSNVTMTLFVWSGLFFCVVLLLGAVLHSPESGLFAVGASLSALLLAHNLVTPFFFHSALQLQLEARDLLTQYPTTRGAGKARLLRGFTDGSGFKLRRSFDNRDNESVSSRSSGANTDNTNARYISKSTLFASRQRPGGDAWRD